MSSPRLCNPVSFCITPHSEWPVALGRKGPTWMLVFTQPRGIQRKREHITINTLECSDPFPPPAPDGHPRFMFQCLLDPSTLTSLAAVRIPITDSAGDVQSQRHIIKPTSKTLPSVNGRVIEVEVLLDESEILHACANCERWETVGQPAFLRCSRCKSRFYCSTECQRDHWVLKHREACSLIRDGKDRAAESIERLHCEGMEWFVRQMMGYGDIDADLIDGPDFGFEDDLFDGPNSGFEDELIDGPNFDGDYDEDDIYFPEYSDSSDDCDESSCSDSEESGDSAEEDSSDESKYKYVLHDDLD